MNKPQYHLTFLCIVKIYVFQFYWDIIDIQHYITKGYSIMIWLMYVMTWLPHFHELKNFFSYTETAHSVLGSDANDVVITVPFDFGEKQKSALG